MAYKRSEYQSVVVPILKYINALPDGKAINIHGSVYTERGTPDVIGSVNGKFVAFECKRDNEELEPIQTARLRQWFRAGAVVGGVSSVEHVDIILRLTGLLKGENDEGSNSKSVTDEEG